MQAIKLDPASLDGYERRYAALHALQRYHEAVDAFTHMFFLLEQSSNSDIQRECRFT